MALGGVCPLDSHKCWCRTSHECCLRTFRSSERSRLNLDRLSRLGNLSRRIFHGIWYMLMNDKIIAPDDSLQKRNIHHDSSCVFHQVETTFSPAAKHRSFRDNECVGKMPFSPASWGQFIQELTVVFRREKILREKTNSVYLCLFQDLKFSLWLSWWGQNCCC